MNNSSSLVTLHAATDVTPDVLDAATLCADAAYGRKNRFFIDWKRVYEDMEKRYNYFVVKLGSPADNKIRRYVRANIRADIFRTLADLVKSSRYWNR